MAQRIAKATAELIRPPRQAATAKWIRRFSFGRTAHVDLSSAVDFSDIPAFIAVLIDGSFQCEADVDQSGMVDFGDIPAMIAVLTAQ